jgi:hypothetical protein
MNLSKFAKSRLEIYLYFVKKSGSIRRVDRPDSLVGRKIMLSSMLSTVSSTLSTTSTLSATSTTSSVVSMFATVGVSEILLF